MTELKKRAKKVVGPAGRSRFRLPQIRKIDWIRSCRFDGKRWRLLPSSYDVAPLFARIHIDLIKNFFALRKADIT